jgi:hypothetical protein
MNIEYRLFSRLPGPILPWLNPAGRLSAAFFEIGHLSFTISARSPGAEGCQSQRVILTSQFSILNSAQHSTLPNRPIKIWQCWQPSARSPAGMTL